MNKNDIVLPKKLFEELVCEADKVDWERRLHKKQVAGTVKVSLNVQRKFGYLMMPSNPFRAKHKEPADKVLKAYLRFKELLRLERMHLATCVNKSEPTPEQIEAQWHTKCFSTLSADDQRCARYAYGKNVHKYFTG